MSTSISVQISFFRTIIQFKIFKITILSQEKICFIFHIFLFDFCSFFCLTYDKKRLHYACDSSHFVLSYYIFVIHIPVLFHEVRDAYLKVSPRKYVIDATQ